jgi:hypothetical protein
VGQHWAYKARGPALGMQGAPHHAQYISNVLCIVSYDKCDNKNVVFLQEECYTQENNFPFTRPDPAQSAISRAQMDGTIDLGRAVTPSSISSSLRLSLKWPKQAEVNWTNVHKCAAQTAACDDTYIKHAWPNDNKLLGHGLVSGF